ncbi:MAG: folylpolyglutamate synthase/dihydrofolate synthase family protein [Rhodospirillaceae bacterium]
MSALPPDRADPVLERLRHLHPKVIDLSLDRIQRLLAALGHPERRLAPVVHVAGTNGKGSTLAFLRACLEAAGYRVHVYTSPHLVRFHERIRLAGTLISDHRLTQLLEECETANGGNPITFFEITTAAALLAFAREPADVVLLETGLGGRLDATTVVDRPAVTAITRISYDHMTFLGDSLTAIAGEKAGILKPGVPAVLAPQPAAEAAHTLLRAAAARGAPLVPWGVKGLKDGGFRYDGPRRALDLPAPALIGGHQRLNAGVALACLDALAGRLPVDDAAVLRGLATVNWPARLQRLRQGPLVAALPAGWELWLDGGHNDSAGEVLAAQAALWAAASPALPLVLVFGMLGTKRPLDFLAPLARHAVALQAVPIPGEAAALTAADAADVARSAGFAETRAATGPADALAALVSTRPGPCRVLICGSLYLAGHVLADHD